MYKATQYPFLTKGKGHSNFPSGFHIHGLPFTFLLKKTNKIRSTHARPIFTTLFLIPPLWPEGVHYNSNMQTLLHLPARPLKESPVLRQVSHCPQDMAPSFPPSNTVILRIAVPSGPLKCCTTLFMQITGFTI